MMYSRDYEAAHSINGSQGLNTTWEESPNPVGHAENNVGEPAWFTFLEYVAVGFGGTLVFIVSMCLLSCIIRIIYSIVIKTREWWEDASEDSMEEDTVHRTVQQQAMWIAENGVHVVIHPGDIPCLGVQSDKKTNTLVPSIPSISTINTDCY